MPRTLIEPEELRPQPIFRAPDGRLVRMTYRKDISRDVSRLGLGLMLELIGVANLVFGHRFHVDIRDEPLYRKGRMLIPKVYWLVMA